VLRRAARQHSRGQWRESLVAAWIADERKENHPVQRPPADREPGDGAERAWAARSRADRRIPIVAAVTPSSSMMAE
jgi:hypothetical protein